VTDLRRASALATALLVVAGCGGGGGRLSHDAYQRELRSAARPLQAALLQPQAPTAGRTAITRRVDEVQHALRRAARRLDGLRAPEDAEDANARLVDGLRTYAAALDAVRAAALGGSAEAIREALDQVSRGTGASDLRRAVGELADAGYQVR
jgi:multidrug efflux pump subunit AcrB